MKVKDMLEKLSKFDPELGIVCSCEDESIAPKGFKLFEIQTIDEASGQRCRTEDGAPSIAFKYGSAPGTIKLVIMDITSEF